MLPIDNTVVGIDLDITPQGWQVLTYIRMLRENGFIRFANTVGRKALGIDRAISLELARQLGLNKLPRLDIRHMDATKMSFADASFDMVFSHGVFEHIDHPESALKEIVRVLRPGGYVHLCLLPYTSYGGAHDMTISAGLLAVWAHLRPQYRHKVDMNAYLNRLTLSQWREIISREFPGAKIICKKEDKHKEDLNELRRLGELLDYTEEELLTHLTDVVWKKPIKAANCDHTCPR
jgi:SAM-dependent methyltransferase